MRPVVCLLTTWVPFLGWCDPLHQLQLCAGVVVGMRNDAACYMCFTIVVRIAFVTQIPVERLRVFELERQ